MGFLQPHVRHGRGDGKTHLSGDGKAVTIISLAQAEAALAAAAATGLPITLLSAPGAAASVGPGWFDAVATLARAPHTDGDVTVVLDCDDVPGDAMAALRHGFRTIRYAGRNQSEIEEIAEQCGARVLRDRPPSLDLEALEQEGLDLAESCRDWLKEKSAKRNITN